MISSELLDERRIFDKHSDPFSSISKWVGIWTFPVFSWNIFEYIPTQRVRWPQVLSKFPIISSTRKFDCFTTICGILNRIEKCFYLRFAFKFKKESGNSLIPGKHVQSIFSHLLFLLNYLFCWLCCSFQLTTREVSFSTNGVHNDIDN
jgi:hypothetical protein